MSAAPTVHNAETAKFSTIPALSSSPNNGPPPPLETASETVGPQRSRVEPSRFLFIHSSEPSKGKFLERSGVMSHCLQGYHKSQRRSRLKLLSYRVPAPALKYDTPPPRAVGRSSLKSGRNGIDEHSKGSLNKLDHKIGDRHSEMGSYNPLISERSQTSLSLVRHFQHPELGLDATKLDPFSTTSAPITRDMQILLEFFTKHVVPRVHPIQRISQETNSLVIPIAVSDAAFLYSVIAMSSQMMHAMNCIRSSGLGSPQTSKEMPGSLLPYHLYKLKAIQLLNPKLDNSSDALQLSTISAVSSLLHIENITGNIVEIAIHTKGLQKLLDMRGGMQHLPVILVEGALRSVYDGVIITHGASITPPPPISRPILSSKTLAFLESVSGTGLSLMANGLLQAPLASFFDFQMLSIIKDMREATVFHEAYKDTKNASPIIQENEYFQMKCVWAIYRLLTFSSQAGLKNIVTSIQEPCRVALLIFICANKNLYPPTSTLARALTAQLKHSLCTAGMEILTLWVAAQDALIWILCLGAHIQGSRTETLVCVVACTDYEPSRNLRMGQSENLVAEVLLFGQRLPTVVDRGVG